MPGPLVGLAVGALAGRLAAGLAARLGASAVTRATVRAGVGQAGRQFVNGVQNTTTRSGEVEGDFPKNDKYLGSLPD